jgi:peptide/nickel transport system permease protein
VLFYLAKRVGMAALVVVLVLLFLATIIHLVPGDPAKIILGQHATPDLIAQVRAQLGLDKPVTTQVWDFLKGAAEGDLGSQLGSNIPVSHLIGQALPDTAILALSSVVLAIAVGIPLGIFAAGRPNSLLDRLTGGLSIVFLAGFPYVVGLLLLILFSVTWPVFPAAGSGSLSHPIDYLRHLVLPAVALAVPWWGYLARCVRASLLEVLGSQYIRTARAFGLRERVIFYKCALKNALVPVVALFGMMLGLSLAGTIYVELIFARPGLGTLAYGSLQLRDWGVIRGAVLVYVIFFVLGNLVADLSYRFLDPRIRVEEAGALAV